MKFGCAICIFLSYENLICRSTDISKCFRGSLQLRDNESRLYAYAVQEIALSNFRLFLYFSKYSSGVLKKNNRNPLCVINDMPLLYRIELPSNTATSLALFGESLRTELLLYSYE